MEPLRNAGPARDKRSVPQSRAWRSRISQAHHAGYAGVR